MWMVSDRVVSRLRSFKNPVFRLSSSTTRLYGTPIASISLCFRSRLEVSANWNSSNLKTDMFDRSSNIEIYFAKSFSSCVVAASVGTTIVNEANESMMNECIVLPLDTLNTLHWYGAIFRWRHISPKSPASMLSRTLSDQMKWIIQLMKRFVQ